MANYKEEKNNGEITKWNRAGEIHINNYLGIAPVVTFNEEVVTQLNNGETFIQKIGTLSKQLVDMNEKIQVIDMTTGIPKGQEISFKEIYDVVASLYLDLAMKRDAEA